jgi:hypothetical protein
MFLRFLLFIKNFWTTIQDQAAARERSKLGPCPPSRDMIPEAHVPNEYLSVVIHNKPPEEIIVQCLQLIQNRIMDGGGGICGLPA